MTDNGSYVPVAVDGTRLFVLDHGVGEPVLFIPPLGFATWTWSRQIPEISKLARVLAMDTRGAGRSGKPPGPYAISQLADDAYAVLTHRGALPAHVVGASMGGYIALTLALRHPEAVRSLVLLATTSGGPGSHGVPPTTLRIWADSAFLRPDAFARATSWLSFAPGWVEEHPAEYEEFLAERLSAPTPPEAWRAQFAACAKFLREGLPSGGVSHPAVIVHGTADRVLPYQNVAHLAARLPQASVVTLQDAGHLCWMERPGVVNEIIADALAEAVPTPGGTPA